MCLTRALLVVLVITKVLVGAFDFASVPSRRRGATLLRETSVPTSSKGKHENEILKTSIIKETTPYDTSRKHENETLTTSVKETTQYDTSRHQRTTRRLLLRGLVAATTSTCVVGGDAWAVTNDSASEQESTSTTEPGVRKPYAPLENLLPATRVKVLIDDAVDTTTELVNLKNNDNDDDKQRLQLVAKLKSLLLEPQEFFKTKQEVYTSKAYLDNETWDDWKRARQKETRKMFEIQSVNPATELNEAFEQWGERRQFKRLRRQQLALEQSNKMRAAFNAYTNNLIFGDSYALTTDRQERKRLIRQYNQLPDVTSVIKSDLDLRDLYRNQVLTAMDDAKAELVYQLKSVRKDESMDFTELLSILREAQTSCSEWFKFVPENDTKDALGVVRGEG